MHLERETQGFSGRRAQLHSGCGYGAERFHIDQLDSINLLYSLSGLMVGVLIGMTGIGGGSLMTPVLILIFGVHPETATAIGLRPPPAEAPRLAIIDARVSPTRLARSSAFVKQNLDHFVRDDRAADSPRDPTNRFDDFDGS